MQLLSQQPYGTREQLDAAIAKRWPGSIAGGLNYNQAMLFLDYGPNWMSTAAQEDAEQACSPTLRFSYPSIGRET